MPPSIIITVALLALALLFALCALTTVSMFPLYVLAAVPLIVFAGIRPVFLLSVTIAVYASQLRLPQTPANLTLHYLLATVTILSIIFHRMIKPGQRSAPSLAKYALAAFCVVVVVTMYFRGAGIRFLGSDLWGGATYVILLVSSGLFMAQDYVVLSSRGWRFTFLALMGMSLLPFLAQLIYTVSGGAIQQQYAFISSEGTVFVQSTLSAVQDAQGVARFNTGSTPLLLFAPLCLAEHPLKGARLFWTLAFALFTLGIAGLSGSRFAIVEIVFLLIIWGSLRAPGGVRWGRLVALSLVGMLLVGILALVANRLPDPMQRALSFIPFSNVSDQTMSDATATLDWRLDLWRLAVKEIPKHLLLGRGVAFDARELMVLHNLGLYARDWALVTGCYHNAALSFLINFGVLGFLSGFAFIVSLSWHHYTRVLPATWSDPSLQRMYYYFFALFASHTALFCTLGGDVQTFGAVIFYGTIMEGIARTNRQHDVTTPAHLVAVPAS